MKTKQRVYLLMTIPAVLLFFLFHTFPLLQGVFFTASPTGVATGIGILLAYRTTSMCFKIDAPGVPMALRFSSRSSRLYS